MCSYCALAAWLTTRGAEALDDRPLDYVDDRGRKVWS